MTTEFENVSSLKSENRHYEQQQAVQKTFVNHVRSLTAVIEGMGNPFLERSQNLLVLEALRHDCNLFSRLYVSYQVRDGNLDNFLATKTRQTLHLCLREGMYD